MYDARVDFWEKWREFLEGGMKAGFFLQKGKHPIEQAEQRAERSRSMTKQSRAGPSRSRKQEAGSRKEAHDKNSKDPHRHIYFPLEIISIVRYRPLEISIQK